MWLQFIEDWANTREKEEAMEHNCTETVKEDEIDQIKKPLKDWTLGEVKAYCEKRVKDMLPVLGDGDSICKGCPIDMVCYTEPDQWDLTEKPRWTEQEREDAKAIKRLFAGVYVSFKRNGIGDLYARHENMEADLLIDSELFPHIAPGQSATLDEIIGGE